MKCHSERSEESPIIKRMHTANTYRRLPTAFWLLPTAFCILLTASCSDPILNKSFPAINETKAGEKFIVNLPENHTEGESWKMDENRKTIFVEMSSSVWHGNEKGVYFHFNALKPGIDTLSFSLNKYNDIQKVSRFIIEVK